ncbi:MAG: hypothetical protein K6C37_05240 [Bacteroidales bacterium]|nr:hypothetical protein [Bacteroidales bacterium]
MKKFLYVLTASVAVVMLFGCREKDEPNDEPQVEPVEYTISGRVEKGPFLKDSKVSLQPLDASFQAVGEPVEVSVSDNLGSYDLGKVSLDCPYAELSATGKFLNEVNESLVESPVTLRALVDLKDKSKVNVNILTNLEYARVKTLMATGGTYESAAAQARGELVKAFGLGGFEVGDFSQYGIAEGTDQSAALILASFSAILQCDNEEIAAYIDKLGKEFGTDGSFSEESKASISESKEIMSWSVDEIATYIKHIYSELGETIEVRNLRSYFDWDENGVVGDEYVPEGSSVKLDKTDLNVPAAGGKYTVNVDSPVALYLEKHGPETEDHEIKPIQPETLNIYDVDMDGVVQMTVSLEGKTLTVDVAPNKGKVVADSVIVLYDFFGTEVAFLAVKQEKEDGIPGLSEDGKDLMKSVFSDLNKALFRWNSLGNVQDPRDLHLEDSWMSWYYTINRINSVKSIDAQNLNVYRPYFDFYLALSYFYLESVWGDVPYVADGSTYDGYGLPRTPQSEVVSNIVTMLEASLEAVEEKPVAANSVSDCFFVSKDCVRLLLAEVYMESGDFRKAAALLNAVSLKNPVDEILVVENYSDPGSKPQVVFGWGDYMCDLAECELALGNRSRAVEIINSFYDWIDGGYDKVSENSDLREEIELIREMTWTRIFLFWRRIGYLKDSFGLKDYQMLWPIPESILVLNPCWKQNPGY